jgi:hypothetical protein
LLLVFSLFVFFGQSAIAVFGIRWIIALIAIISGSAAVLAARLRGNRRSELTANNAETESQICTD